MRNRNRRKHVVAGSHSLLWLWIVLLFCMVVFYGLEAGKCTAIGGEIGAAEKKQTALEKEFRREAARWNDNLTRERIAAALHAHGIPMRRARLEQIVRMKNGVPLAQQPSMVAFRNGKNSSISKTNVARK